MEFLCYLHEFMLQNVGARFGLTKKKSCNNIFPLLHRTKRTNSHVPVIINVHVASTVESYLFIHSFLGRREEIKHTGCYEGTAAVYYVSR